MRKTLMSWEGPPAFRWIKMFKGVRYRVTCAELGLPPTDWNKEDSYRTANEWWKTKLATIKKPEEEVEVVSGDAGEFAFKVTMPKSKSADLANRAERMIDDYLHAEPVPKNFTWTHQSARFLDYELQRGKKPETWGEVRDFVGRLEGHLKVFDIRTINEQTVTDFYLFLCKSAYVSTSRKKYFNIFKRVVHWLYTERLIDLPRNLAERKHTFNCLPKPIATYTVDEVTDCLDEVGSRMRLYALLGLNCGMLGVDVGSLLKSEVDLKAGRITRKRTKTKDEKNVPTVVYPLWPETLRLLEKHLDRTDSPLALTSSVGSPLWSSTIVQTDKGPKKRKNDLVAQQWGASKQKIPHKAFRSISATVLGSHPDHERIADMFLGHSPASLADKHYKAPSQERFDAAVKWLGEQYGY